MTCEGIDSFPSDVLQHLRTYVYRLIDPRNGQTFYVGKGTGNRVFAHIREDVADDEPDPKLRRIREIRLSGLEVQHVIHRHGMDERTAIEVEAAVMDAYPALTNIARGAGSDDFGVVHTREIMNRYAAEPAEFKHRALLIKINQTATERSIYEATRYAWKVDKSKAEQAEVILAVYRGLIVGAFVAHQWLAATEENFPGREPAPNRYGFVGEEAPNSLKEQYLDRRLPEEYSQPGAASPVRYTWSK